MSFWHSDMGDGSAHQDGHWHDGPSADPAPHEAAHTVADSLAHLDRNAFQAGVAPAHLPDHFPYVDPNTSITWQHDNLATEAIFHGRDNDCIRGEFPPHTVAEMRADPTYRARFAEMGGHWDYDVDRIVPGAQFCYGPDGTLIDHGPHQGTLDYASPDVAGQKAAHFHMDVAPDYHNDNYLSPTLSAGSTPAHVADQTTAHETASVDGGGGHADPGGESTSTSSTSKSDSGSGSSSSTSSSFSSGGGTAQ